MHEKKWEISSNNEFVIYKAVCEFIQGHIPLMETFFQFSKFVIAMGVNVQTEKRWKKRNKMKKILMITSDQNPRELEEEEWRMDHIMPNLEPIALIGEQRCCDFVEWHKIVMSSKSINPQFFLTEILVKHKLPN